MHIDSHETIGVPVLRRVICLATIEPSVGLGEVRRIASDYREVARCLDVTGVLLHKEGMLLHIIEGSTSSIDELMTKIKSDRRQQSIHLSSDERVERQSFRTWIAGTSLPSAMSLSEGEMFGITKAKLEELATQADSNLVSSFLITFFALESDPTVTVMYC